MTQYGSDKGRHKYTAVYSVLFKGWCGQSLRVFELGLGTNNPKLPSNMEGYGVPGASLRGWREMFPHAVVYGADIDRDISFQGDRIRTFYCNQLDQSAIRELWSHPDLRGGMDIIIDDGLHPFEANVSFLEGSLNRLRPGGIYVIEDIFPEWIDRWYDQLETIYSKGYPSYEFAFVGLVERFLGDSNLIIIRRGME